MAAVRRLTDDEEISAAFATNWPEYDLDPPTRALLAYVSKLTESPATVDGLDTAALREAGWSERAVWEITALAAAVEAGAETMHPPLEIPGQGRFAIYMHGGIQNGLWPS